MRAVEEAIMRQVIHGGDLPTNLLELGAVSEQALIWVLAETFGLEPAPVGSLPAPDPAALKTVPGDLALRHAMFPLELTDRTLVVAIAEPLSPAVEEDLSFALDVNIRQLTTTMVRVREGIAAHYGLRLDKRFLRLLAKLEGHDDPHPSSMPPAMAGVGPIHLPRPASVPPVTFGTGVTSRPEPPARHVASPVAGLEAHAPVAAAAQIPIATPVAAAPVVSVASPDATPPPAAAQGGRRLELVDETGIDSSHPPPVVDRAGLAGWLVRTAAKERKAKARPPRRKGPFALPDAEEELSRAEAAEDVLEIWFHFATQYFEYSALFSIVGDLAEGRDAHGAGAGRDRVSGVGVPLDLPSSLASAVASRTPSVKRFADSGLDAELLGDLAAQAAIHRSTVALIPLVVRDRTVAIVLGHDGDADVTFEAIGELLSFTSLVAAALERLILIKKLGKDRAAALIARAPVVPRKQDPKKGAQALAAALALPRSEPPPPVQVSPGATSVAPRAEAVDSTKPYDDAALTPGAPASVAILNAPPHAERPRHDTFPGVGDPGEESGEGADSLSIDVPPFYPPPATAAAVLPMSERPIPREEGVAEAHGPDASARPPDASAILMSAHTPSPPSARIIRRSRLDEGPPEIVSLLHHMLEGGLIGEEAFEALLEIGEHSMPALMQAFPGPLKVDRYRARAELPAASQCGPLLQVLVTLRRVALAFVTVKSSSTDADDRFWATHLLGEMRAPEAATALIPRLFDDDPSVRRIARRSAAALVHAGDPGVPLMMTLDHLVRSSDEPIERRVLAIETMGEIRVGQMIPSLIAVLAGPSADVGEAARKALLLIARQDFGRDQGAWSRWWNEKRHQHRIEWLIDALMHDQPGIRRTAADELKLLTKEYFGYYDDLPTRERERAQERYREWWDREGAERFR